jgi:GTP-binding protein HflX
VVSIVGYTNAGKSTLLNAMTNSEVLAEDKLFATLDPTSRRLRFPESTRSSSPTRSASFATCPRTWCNAFRATLEELEEASLLLHVVDAADPARLSHVEAVEKIEAMRETNNS